MRKLAFSAAPPGSLRCGREQGVSARHRGSDGAGQVPGYSSGSSRSVTRQNTSEAAALPSAAEAVYAMTQTVTGAEQFLSAS